VSRSVGAVDAVTSLLPEAAALPVGLLTQLGDVWFLLAVIVLAYWLRPADRNRVAVVLAIALGTIALVQALKGVFGLPRPATPLGSAGVYPSILHGLFDATATASGHGFPSGHATLSTAVLLGLAGAIRAGTPRRRAVVAVGLIALISLSRIALGVHFLVDVVAGVLVGLVVLSGAALAVRGSPTDAPTTAFVGAAGIGVVAVLVTAPSLDVGGLLAHPARDSLLSLGAALGALAGWQTYSLLDRGAVSRSTGRFARPGSVRAGVVVGLPVLLLTGGIAGLLAGEGALGLAGAGGLCFAVAVALPALVPGFDAEIGAHLPEWVRAGNAPDRDADRPARAQSSGNLPEH